MITTCTVGNSPQTLCLVTEILAIIEILAVFQVYLLSFASHILVVALWSSLVASHKGR